MSIREGQNISRPPLLDGSNYTYWKMRMRAFIKSIDDRAWRSIIFRYDAPIVVDTAGVTHPKLESLWTADEDKAAATNAKALNAIFNVVEPDIFRLISTCEAAKEAWDIATRFKDLKMKEE